MAHIHTKLHQFLISSFLHFCADTQTHTQTHTHRRRQKQYLVAACAQVINQTVFSNKPVGDWAGASRS